jgi:hypothetical protein
VKTAAVAVLTGWIAGAALVYAMLMYAPDLPDWFGADL